LQNCYAMIGEIVFERPKLEFRTKNSAPTLRLLKPKVKFKSTGSIASDANNLDKIGRNPKDFCFKNRTKPIEQWLREARVPLCRGLSYRKSPSRRRLFPRQPRLLAECF